MDAENVKDRRLTLDNYKQMVNMLKGSDEDFNIALENILNLKDESHYWNILNRLFYKEIVFSRRYDFNSKFGIANDWRDPQDHNITYNALHSEIQKLNNEDLKSVFSYVVNRDLNQTYKSSYDFFDSVDIKIKW